MKKLLVCLSAVVAFAASASWQKVADLQVADSDSLVQGVSKFGELTGNVMLGTMASAALMQMPGADLFGPGRDKTPMTFCLFVDDAKLETVLADSEKFDADDVLSYALLYPVRQTKAEFVKEHEGCTEANGVLRVVEDDEDDDDDEGDDDEDVRFVAFSKDGKWASMSDNPDRAKLGLEDLRLAGRPMKGDLVKLAVTPKGVSAVRRMLEKAKDEIGRKAKDKDRADALSSVKYVTDLVKGISVLVGGIAIDDKGLAVRGSVGTVKGSELAKCGLKTLEDDPFAFAPKSTLVAVAFAADCGQRTFDLDALFKVLAKHGIKTDSFLKVEEFQPGNKSVLTFDVPAAVAYGKKEGEAIAKKFDAKALKKDLGDLTGPGDSFVATNPPASTALALKDYVSPVSASERLAAVLPEAKQKKPFSVQVFSVYSLVKAVLPSLLAQMETDDRAEVGPLVKSLPPEGKGGIGLVGWRENDRLSSLLRISADELKLLSSGFSAFSAYQMQTAMKAAKKAQGQKKSAKKPQAKPAAKAKAK